MAAGPIVDASGNVVIGAPTVQRLMVCLEALSARGFCDLQHTAQHVCALEDGTEKEALLVRLAAEALFYSNELREAREARQNEEATRTVMLTPETHGTHVVRFDATISTVDDPPLAGAPGKVTVVSIDKVVP